MALKFRDVEWPFAGKLDESVHPKLNEQGFTVVENAVWTDEGAVEKRPGVAVAFGTAMPASAHRLIPYESQLLLSDGSHTLYACRDQGDTVIEADKISEVTVKRVGIRREMDQSVTDVDMAVAGQYTVYVWRNADDQDVLYRIVETATGTIVLTGVANIAAASVPSPALRLASNGAYVLLTYAVPSANTIYARRIDCTTHPPTVGSETALVTDLNGTNPDYDICAMTAGTAGWAVYYQNTTPVGRAREVNNANPPTLGWDRTLLFDRVNVACCEVGTFLFIAANGASTDYVVLNRSDGTVALASTILDTPTATGAMGVVAVSSTVALFSWKTNTGLMKWRTGGTTGTLGATHTQFRVFAESKPFYVAATDEVYQWVRTNTENSTRVLFVLAHLNRGGVADINMRPVASAAFGEAYPTPERFRLGNVTAQFDTDRRTAMPVLIATGSTLLAGDELRATWGNLDRHLHQRFGRSVYIGGGVLQQWDGRQLTEVGYLQSPHFTAVASAGGGSLPVGDYNVALVYEEYDDNGEIQRSLPFFKTAPVTIAAGDKIACTIWPLTMTLRQDFSQQTPRVELALYITNTNSAGPYFRVDVLGSADPNNFNATTTTTRNIIGPVDTSNPTIYTDGGVLENDAVYSGATILALHKDRLWVANGDEIAWYSQPRVDGEPALFNLAQQVRIPGHEISGLASLDDALVILTKTGLFRVHGEGPNATGDLSSGAFSEPIPIVSDTGCTRGPASVVVIPSGVFFGGEMGFYLLGRDFTVIYIGAPVEDTVAANADVIRRATLVPDYSQIRVVIEDS